jgi:hypothetical protein
LISQGRATRTPKLPRSEYETVLFKFFQITFRLILPPSSLLGHSRGVGAESQPGSPLGDNNSGRLASRGVLPNQSPGAGRSVQRPKIPKGLFTLRRRGVYTTLPGGGAGDVGSPLHPHGPRFFSSSVLMASSLFFENPHFRFWFALSGKSKCKISCACVFLSKRRPKGRASAPFRA